MGQKIYFARFEPTFRNQLGLGRGKSGKARFLSTKYQGALKKGIRAKDQVAWIEEAVYMDEGLWIKHLT